MSNHVLRYKYRNNISRTFSSDAFYVTKFTHGAWMVVIAIPTLMAIMSAIYVYYGKVSDELSLTSSANLSLPSRIHGIILVSKLHKPTELIKRDFFILEIKELSLDAAIFLVQCLIIPNWPRVNEVNTPKI